MFLFSVSMGQQGTNVIASVPLTAGHAASTRLDIASVEAATHCYFRAGIAASTTRVYDSAKRRHMGDTWASAPNVTCHNCYSRNTLCLFATHLAMYHRQYLSGLWHLQITAGLSDSFKTGAFPRLQYVIKGINREKRVQIKP